MEQVKWNAIAMPAFGEDRVFGTADVRRFGGATPPVAGRPL
jgi:hypothetical protein